MQAVEAELAELLAEDDVEHLAAAMEPGSVAGGSSGRTSGQRHSRLPRALRGQLIANGRIPIQAIIASIEADEAAGCELRRLKFHSEQHV